MDHERSPPSEDDSEHVDDATFARMMERSIPLGVPTEIEERVMNEMSFYKRPADPNVARGVSQSIYKYLLPEKLQEVKDEEIFQNFRPPTAGLDDPLLTAPAKNIGPIATSGSQPTFRKSGSVGRFPSPRDNTAALLWGKK